MDEDRYVISARDILEIIPFVTLKAEPTLPAYAAGSLNYRGDCIPVIDLCQLLIKRSCRKRLSTRIIIIENTPGIGKPMKLGLMVEKATEMVSIGENIFKPPVMKDPDASISGLIGAYKGFLVTSISISDVVEKLDKKLFSDIENTTSESPD